MNFFAIIQGFGEYLRELTNQEDGSFEQQSGNISIFNYASEFKEYLAQNYGADASVFSSNISDLMNMEIVNGQFSGDASIFSQETQSGSSMGELLNNLLADSSVISALDQDGSGDLNRDEINVFLQAISNSDNNAQDISLDDLLNASQAIQQGNFTLNPDGTITIGDTTTPAAETTEKPKKTKHHHHSKTHNTKDKDSVSEKNLDTMSKSELSTELSSASGDVAAKQNKLNAILDGSDPELSGLKDNIETSYQAYLEQLNTVNKDLAGQVDTLKGSIDAKQSEIDSKEAAISQQENTVTDAKTSYDNAVSSRENLESILSELNSTDTSNMDESAKSSIQSKIEQVKDKLEQAKQDEKDRKTDWDNAKEELTKLEGEKTELETGSDGLSKLKEQMTQLEAEVNTQYPQISQYLNEYNQAKQTYEQTKTSAIESAKAELKTAKDYETKVKTAYQDAENEEDTSNFSPVMYNKETAAKIAELAKKYANKMDTVGNCLVGVARAIREFLGLKHTALSPLPKAYLAAEQFRTDPVLSKHFKEVKVDRSDLANLPAGAVVVWNKSEGHSAGHISIALGNGKEASDHIQKQMNRQNAEFTVFYPV